MSLVRNTLVQTGLTLVSRVLGFARDLVFAAILGAGPIADAFYAAQRFPNLFRRFFAEGAFSQAFVPIYSKAAASDPQAAAQLASQALSLMVGVTLALTVLLQIAMPALYLGLFAGYADGRGVIDAYYNLLNLNVAKTDPFEIGVMLAILTMPYLVFMTMAALFSGVLNAGGRFALSAAAPTVLNIILLAAVAPFLLIPQPSEADKVNAAYVGAIAITASGLVQAALLWWGAARQKVRMRLGLPRLTPEMRRLMALAIPGAIAGSGVQINIMVSQAIASLQPGAITYLYNADRLYQLPLGLIGVAVGLALLPRLARAVAAGEEARSRQALDEAVSLAMAFTLPAAAALLVLAEFLMIGFWVRGAFTLADATASAAALYHFAWGVPAFVLIKVFAPAFFAREDTRRPMVYSLIAVAANIALGIALFFGLRALNADYPFVGLAIATSAAAWLNALLLAATLLRERHYAPSPAALFRLGRILLASAIMAAALFAADRFYRQTLIDALGAKEFAILAICFAGLVIYALAALAVRAVRPSELKSALRREPAPPGLRLSDGGE